MLLYRAFQISNAKALVVSLAGPPFCCATHCASRLWHLKRLGATDFDETWDPYNTCVGHNPDDLQPFHGLFPTWDAANATLSGKTFSSNNGEPASIKDYYRNSELYELLRPDTTNLPYMYDNFAWPHCSVS